MGYTVRKDVVSTPNTPYHRAKTWVGNSWENLIVTECVSVALVNQHAVRMSHIIYCLSGSTTFFHVFSQRARFSEKTLLNTQSVF